MKKTIAAILALLMLLLCAAQAENRFTCDVFSIDLPDGMRQLDDTARAGYEAAVQSDYPNVGETLLIAQDESRILYIATGADSDPQTAAESAASLLLGDASAAAEYQTGDRTAWGFACSVSDMRFDIYYLKENQKSIVIGVSGMEAAAISDVLSTIQM